jgi:hypothetical protein
MSLFDEQGILSSLSEPLRRDVTAHIATQLISAVPLLRDANPGFLNAILPLLRNVCPHALALGYRRVPKFWTYGSVC